MQQKPTTAQPHGNPTNVLKSDESLLKSQDFLRGQNAGVMDGSRPDQADSADNPHVAFSTNPPNLRGKPDSLDTADHPATAPPPENADIPER